MRSDLKTRPTPRVRCGGGAVGRVAGLAIPGPPLNPQGWAGRDSAPPSVLCWPGGATPRNPRGVGLGSKPVAEAALAGAAADSVCPVAACPAIVNPHAYREQDGENPERRPGLSLGGLRAGEQVACTGPGRSPCGCPRG